MEYSFNVMLAKKYGVDEAIMIKNILFWVLKNKANGNNRHNGRTWTYNSIRAFGILFPFWTEKQIRRILASLEKKEVIMSGNYNLAQYDRTKWYAFVNEDLFVGNIQDLGSESICPPAELHLPKRSNQIAQKGEPIPDNKPDINTYKYILDYWNTKKMYSHKEGTFLTNLKKKHRTIIKDIGKEEILQAIDNYSKIVAGEDYYFRHKWSLWDFIDRGAYKFVNAASPLDNYRKEDNPKDTRKAPPIIKHRWCDKCGNLIIGTMGYCVECGKVQ